MPRPTKKKAGNGANLALLAAKPNKKISNRLPAEYLAEIAEKHPGRLEAQAISIDRSLWKLERFQDVLAARHELLAAAVTDLIADPT